MTSEQRPPVNNGHYFWVVAEAETQVWLIRTSDREIQTTDSAKYDTLKNMFHCTMNTDDQLDISEKLFLIFWTAWVATKEVLAWV